MGSSSLTRHRSTIAVVGALAMACTMPIAGSAASGLPALPARVNATRLPADTAPFKTAGTVVPSSALGVRVFVGSEKGFALANLGGATYPAATVDRGTPWRIAGPHLHVNAANAPDVVTEAGAISTSTYFAYGGGMTVDVTSNGGATWWRADMPGAAVAVVPSESTGRGALAALVETNPGRFAAYVSSDGGRHWTHTTSFV
jgi:hypothetical protein